MFLLYYVELKKVYTCILYNISDDDDDTIVETFIATNWKLL